MALPMRNLIQRNGVYAVRVQLPADVRAAFGKTAAVRSLKTRNLNDALEQAGREIAAIKRQIEKVRCGESASQIAITPTPQWSPDDAFDAIQRWAKATIDKSYLDHFHGLATNFSPFGDEAVALSERLHALQEHRFGDIMGFDASLVEAIAGQRLDITITHPSIPHLRAWFGHAWVTVEGHSARFRRGDFSEWSLHATPEPSGSRQHEIEGGYGAAGPATRSASRFRRGGWFGALDWNGLGRERVSPRGRQPPASGRKSPFPIADSRQSTAHPASRFV
jgi:hypothetical protein